MLGVLGEARGVGGLVGGTTEWGRLVMVEGGASAKEDMVLDTEVVDYHSCLPNVYRNGLRNLTVFYHVARKFRCL